MYLRTFGVPVLGFTRCHHISSSSRSSLLCMSNGYSIQRRSQSSVTANETNDTQIVKESNGMNAPTRLTGLKKQNAPPHSLLPTKMLLRSFLVSTVSSHPWLLRPALSFLLLVTKKPFWALDVHRNKLLNWLLKTTFYDHFCAGENRQEVTSTIKSIKDMGCKGVILTYAREIVVDERTKQDKGLGAQAADEKGVSSDMEKKQQYADVEAWRSGVLDTLDMISEGDFLALKFTGAGLKVTQALKANKPLPPPMLAALDEICQRASSRNVRILVDAEQQSVQPAIDDIALRLMREYNRGEMGAIVYNTYQMYLKQMVGTLNQHMKIAAKDGYTLGVKMVRGAYIGSEPRKLIHDTKENTDRAYDGSLKALLERKYINEEDPQERPLEDSGSSSALPPIDLFVASHNKESAFSAVQWHQERVRQGLPTVGKIQYGQLLGMADEVSCGLIQLKQTQNGSEVKTAKIPQPEVYKCLSWGSLEDCLSYLLRRAVENRDAVGRTKTEEVATRRELWRRMKASLGLAA